jgi:hypothetical protein
LSKKKDLPVKSPAVINQGESEEPGLIIKSGPFNTFHLSSPWSSDDRCLEQKKKPQADIVISTAWGFTIAPGAGLFGRSSDFPAFTAAFPLRK